MAKSAPGKHYRKGIGFVELIEMFPDDAAAEKWLIDWRWEGEPYCPHCGSANVNMKAKHKSMPHRCRERECGKHFSVRTDSVMHRSHLSARTWAIAIYLYNTNLKGISSMRMPRELKITQRTAWYLLQRLREMNAPGEMKFTGPVQVDEAYIGPIVPKMNRKARDRHETKHGKGTGGTGKILVAAMKEPETRRMQMAVLPDGKKETLERFVLERTEEGTMVHTDEAAGYKGLEDLGREHETVNHSAGEYVRYIGAGDIVTNKRRGIVLVHLQGRPDGCLSPCLPEAPAALCQRTRGTLQR